MGSITPQFSINNKFFLYNIPFIAYIEWSSNLVVPTVKSSCSVYMAFIGVFCFLILRFLIDLELEYIILSYLNINIESTFNYSSGTTNSISSWSVYSIISRASSVTARSWRRMMFPCSMPSIVLSAISMASGLMDSSSSSNSQS